MNDHSPDADSLIEQGARAAAQRLTPEHGPGLKTEVEAALHARGTTQRPDQYIDPISLGSLIVSVAALAWTVYKDLRTRTPKPAPEVIARRVRVELPTTNAISATKRDQVIEIVVDEITKNAG